MKNYLEILKSGTIRSFLLCLLVFISGHLASQHESDLEKAIDHAIDIDADSKALLEFKDLEADVADKGTNYEKAYFYFARASREEFAGFLDDAFISINEGEKHLKKLPQDSVWYWLQLYRLQSLGNIYYSLGQYEKALERYSEARKICEGKYSFTYQGLLNNIATSHALLLQYEKAYEVLTHGLRHYRQIKDTLRMLDMYYNYGVLKMQQEDYETAQFYADSGYGLAMLAQDYFSLGLQLILQADLAFFKSEWDKCVNDYSRAAEVYDSLGMLRTHSYITRHLALAYEKKGDLQNALDYFRITADIEDSTAAREYAAEVSKQQVAFETREKENALLIKELELQNETQEKEAAITTRNYLSLAIFLVLITSLFFIRSYRQRQILARQQVEISNQKVDDLIVRQEIKLLDALTDGQEKERKRLARDLHDRMGSLLVNLKMQFETMKEQLPAMEERFVNSGKLIKEAISEVRRISHNLASQSIAEYGLIPALRGLQQSIEQTGKLKMEIMAHDMDRRLRSNMEVEIYRIIQEIVSNTLKHSEAKSINVNLSRDENEFSLLVEDDGIGFDSSRISGGIGLRNLKTRARDLGGELVIDSTPGRGTTVILNLPLREIRLTG